MTQRSSGLAPSICGSRESVLAVPLSVFAGCFLVILSAQARIPVPGTDVPGTLQLLAVLLVGFSLSPARAVAATLLYLLCGAAGLPVFAGSVGLMGSTGGYIVGFVLAAWLVSHLAGGRDAVWLRLLAAGSAGLVVVFAAGSVWRVCLVLLFGGLGDSVGLAVSTGVVPFVLKGVIELLVAVALVGAIRGGRRASADADVARGN